MSKKKTVIEVRLSEGELALVDRLRAEIREARCPDRSPPTRAQAITAMIRCLAISGRRISGE